LSAFWALVALGLATASPVLDNAATVGEFFGIGLAPGSPDLGQPSIAQEQILFAHDLAIGSPEFGIPWRLPSKPPIYPPEMDRHVRRSGDDYAQALTSLLPRGLAWPRQPETILMRAVSGLAQIWGYVDSRAADLLERESDPRTTLDLLPDWERNWGLPDACFPATNTIEGRRAILLLKMTMLGAQSRAFFISIAVWLGYSITIEEYAPFMAGVSSVGDTAWLGDGIHPRWQIGPPEMRFYWTVHVAGSNLVWFRCGSGQAGVDHHLELSEPLDLECLFRRWKPAQTDIIFDLSNLQTGGPMAGTP
jgi:uncharacterized protein YmfQ (DUF2313 family)